MWLDVRMKASLLRLPPCSERMSRVPVRGYTYGCYNCGQEGHIAVDCPTLRCMFCKMVGHFKSDCPKLPQGSRGRKRPRDETEPSQQASTQPTTTNQPSPGGSGEGVVPTATNGNATNQPFPNPNSTGEGVVPTATNDNATNQPFPNPNSTGKGVAPTATNDNTTNQLFPNPNSTGEAQRSRPRCRNAVETEVHVKVLRSVGVQFSGIE